MTMRRSLEFLALIALFSFSLGTFFLAGYYAHAWSLAYPGLRWELPGLPPQTDDGLLNEVRGLIDQNFLGELPEPAVLARGAARGYVAALGDPYTIFLDPPAAELESQSLQGEYGGVGVELSLNAAGEVVLKPIPDAPAEVAGILAGDVLIRVDDEALPAGRPLEEITALVRGPIGTPVHLTVRRGAAGELSFTITRQAIPVPSVTWSLAAGQPAVGLITLSRFSDRTARELERAARELTAQGAHSFVLDLRNNGGGLLDAAVAVAGQFLDGGPVMIETSRLGADKTYTAAAGAGPLTTAPLAVLVNGNTASAAEILAGALLDRERAPLIGQTTYGKGSVQFVFPLSDGSNLHVTANRWFTPTRRQLDKAGLPPTYPVEPAADGGDAELARALDYLRSVTP